MLDAELLRTLIAISECGTFADAACRLNQTPSAISMQMKRLEFEINQPVFEKRSGKKVRLSKAGEILIPYAHRVMSLLQNAITDARDAHDQEEVTIGISDDYVECLLPNLVLAFKETYPGRGMKIITGSSGDLYEKVRMDAIDTAIVTGRNAWPDLDVFVREPLVWVSTPRPQALNMTPLPIALFREGCVRRAIVLEALIDNDVPFTIAYSSGTLSGLVAIARTGLAVVPMARCCIPADLAVVDNQRNLPMLPNIEIGAVYRRDVSRSDSHRSTIARAFDRECG